MFDDDTQTTVPEPGSADSAAQTEGAATPQTPPTETTKPESTTQAQPTSPTGLSKDDVAAIIREELQNLRGEFATREDLSRAAQGASDKRFAKLLKELGPEMRGIETAVKRGLMDAEQAKIAKQELFAEKAMELAGRDEEEETPPPAQQLPAPQQANPLQVAANKLLEKHGFTWADFPKETLPKTFEEFVVLVTNKSADRRVQAEKTAWQKQYEEQTKGVREADKAGATKPPVGGAPPSKPKRSLADADRLGSVIADRYFKK